MWVLVGARCGQQDRRAWFSGRWRGDGADLHAAMRLANAAASSLAPRAIAASPATRCAPTARRSSPRRRTHRSANACAAAGWSLARANRARVMRESFASVSPSRPAASSKRPCRRSSSASLAIGLVPVVGGGGLEECARPCPVPARQRAEPVDDRVGHARTVRPARGRHRRRDGRQMDERTGGCAFERGHRGAPSVQLGDVGLLGSCAGGFGASAAGIPGSGQMRTQNL